MNDKTVVVTGATSGLGKATALQIAQKGALVINVARNSSKADAFIDNIAEAGGTAKSVIADLSSMVDTRKAADRIKKVAGRIDVLINNAGAHFPEYKETSEGFEQTLALNYLSPFLLTHHLLEQIDQTASAHGEARIINISSIMHKSPIKTYGVDIGGRKGGYQQIQY